MRGAGKPTEGYPWQWSVYRWLEGDHPEADALSEPVLLATDLAEFVTAIRTTTLPGAPRAYRGGPVALLDSSTRAAIDQLRGIPEEDIDCDAVAAVWEESLRVPAWDKPDVWLHADLMPGNLLVDSGRLSSVIDFGCVGVGDPACGVQLLEPDGRRVRLTATAHKLLTHADALHAQWERARADLELRRDGQAGHLRLSGVATAVVALIAPATRTLQRRHPQMTFEVGEDPGQDRFKLLLAGQTDMAVVIPAPDSPPPDDPRFEQHELLEQPQDLLVPGEHRFSGRAQGELRDAAGKRGSAPATPTININSSSQPARQPDSPPPRPQCRRLVRDRRHGRPRLRQLPVAPTRTASTRTRRDPRPPRRQTRPDPTAHRSHTPRQRATKPHPAWPRRPHGHRRRLEHQQRLVNIHIPAAGSPHPR